MTSVIRRPLGQWLRSPRNILRNSAMGRFSTGLDWLTTIATLGSAAGAAIAPASLNRGAVTNANDAPASINSAIDPRLTRQGGRPGCGVPPRALDALCRTAVPLTLLFSPGAC